MHGKLSTAKFPCVAATDRAACYTYSRNQYVDKNYVIIIIVRYLLLPAIITVVKKSTISLL